MKTNNKGFTLVELLITMVISTVIMAAIYSSYTLQQKSYYSQSQVVEMQQNLRAALQVMLGEIRMAGYDPLDSADAGIVAASATGMQFTLDTIGSTPYNESDGDTSDADENITYQLVSTDLQRNGSTIAENIEEIEFRYQLEDGTWTAIPAAGLLDKIRTVQIAIIARASQPTPNFTSGSFETPAGTQTYTDNFRRRLMVSSVVCRNMGI